jgi:phosphatidate cytidylyltransferase
VSTFLKRTLSGAVYVLAVIGAIFAGPVFFGVLLAVFLVMGLFEFVRLTQIDSPSFKWVLILSGVLLYAAIVLYTWKLFPAEILFITVFVPFILLIVPVIKNRVGRTSEAAWMIFGFVYLVVPFVLLNLLYYPGLDFSAHSHAVLLGFFAVIWMNDTFAYLTGTAFGKHKFAEKISPKKTWEGIFGGLLASIISGYILSLFFNELNFLQWMVFSLLIVIFGTFGDLLESVLKRNFNVKDSGKVIPGHGGILDRFDSILLAAPFVFVYLQLID